MQVGAVDMTFWLGVGIGFGAGFLTCMAVAFLVVWWDAHRPVGEYEAPVEGDQ